jgi:hypothetical protein
LREQSQQRPKPTTHWANPKLLGNELTAGIRTPETTAMPIRMNAYCDRDRERLAKASRSLEAEQGTDSGFGRFQTPRENQKRGCKWSGTVEPWNRGRMEECEAPWGFEDDHMTQRGEG